jgi:hypothetical protein
MVAGARATVVDARRLRRRLVVFAVVASATTALAAPIARAEDAPPRAAETQLQVADSSAQLRAEIAGALNVDPSDPRVDLALVEAQMNGTLPAATPVAQEQAGPAGTAVGPAVKYDPVAERLDLLKKEMEKAGLTDEMIAKGYYKETPFTIGGRAGVLIEGLTRGPGGPVSIHGYSVQQKDGSIMQSVTTTNLATGEQNVTTGVRDTDGRDMLTGDFHHPGTSGDTGTGGSGAATSTGTGVPGATSTTDTGDSAVTYRATSFTDDDGTTYTSSVTGYPDGTTVNTDTSTRTDGSSTTETHVTDDQGDTYTNTTKTDADGNVTSTESSGESEDGEDSTNTTGTDDDSGAGTATDDDDTATAMTSEDGSASVELLDAPGPTRLEMLGHPVGGDLGDGATIELDAEGRPILRTQPIVGDPMGDPETVEDGTLHLPATAGPEYGPNGPTTVDPGDGPPENDPYGPISLHP